MLFLASPWARITAMAAEEDWRNANDQVRTGRVLHQMAPSPVSSSVTKLSAAELVTSASPVAHKITD